MITCLHTHTHAHVVYTYISLYFIFTSCARARVCVFVCVCVCTSLTHSPLPTYTHPRRWISDVQFMSDTCFLSASDDKSLIASTVSEKGGGVTLTPHARLGNIHTGGIFSMHCLGDSIITGVCVCVSVYVCVCVCVSTSKGFSVCIVSATALLRV
jgi:hypothetical protein